MIARIVAWFAVGASFTTGGTTVFAAQAPTPGTGSQQPEAVVERFRARPSILLERRAIKPGQVNHFAISFEIDKHWHLYWKGFNVSGMEPQVVLTLPEGWHAEPIQWPAPHRDVLEGDILNHIHEDRLTLIIPVAVPADAAAGSRHEIAASLHWLVCADACIREEKDISATFTVAESEGDVGPSEGAKWIAEARLRVPKPWPAGGVPGVEMKYAGRVLSMTAPGAKALRFFPEQTCLPLVDAIADGEAKGERLRVRFEPPLTATLTNTPAPAVRGVVEIDRGRDEPAAWYDIEIPDKPGASTP